MAMWDNRSTQHYAVMDYPPCHRKMERAGIIGDHPVLTEARSNGTGRARPVPKQQVFVTPEQSKDGRFADNRHITPGAESFGQDIEETGDRMYRHLLVPIDDSQLSVETVNQAVSARPRARRAGDVLPRPGRLRCVEPRRARARDVARRVQRADGRRGARAARQGRGRRAHRGRRARLGRDDQRPACRGDSRRRRSARLRPHLHGVPRPARPQGHDGRLADASTCCSARRSRSSSRRSRATSRRWRATGRSRSSATSTGRSRR